MTDGDRVKLLHGPYTSPALRRGDRATCLFRDADVVITAWSGGRIPWPRCRALGRRGGSGLLVNEELARAVRTESAAAVMYWWGVTEGVVWGWRKALGVEGRAGTEGSRRLIRAAALAGAVACRGRRLSPEQVEHRRRTALALSLWRHLRPGYHGPLWTMAQLGKIPDEEVAARIGRTPNAVRVKRGRLGIRGASD